MNEMLQDIQENWHIYAAMPLVAALIGYLTKVMAVEMMFRPLHFRGIKPVLGWQGVIPRSAPRIASVAMDLLVGRLIDPKELIARIDLDALAKELDVPMRKMVDELCREVMPRLMPLVWNVMPETGRKLIILRIEESIPETLERLVRDMQDNVDEILDIKTLAIDALVSDPAKTVKLIRTVGKNELKFIVKMGAPFGFAVGLVQAMVWAATHSPLVMPLFGALTGSLTDWLALQMIFRPVKKRRFFFIFPWQGLFHKRRDEVTRDYSTLIAGELITPANVLESLMTGPRSDLFLSQINSEIEKIVDERAGLAKPLVLLSVGDANYRSVKTDVTRHVIKSMREGSEAYEDKAADAIKLPDFIIEKMDLLKDDEYEQLLRPAFKQDEWKLVVVGAVLGLLVGELQLHLLIR